MASSSPNFETVPVPQPMITVTSRSYHEPSHIYVMYLKFLMMIMSESWIIVILLL